MAVNGKKGAKAPKQSGLLSAIRAAGYGDNISKTKTKLWDLDNADEVIADVFEDEDADVSIFMNTEFESFSVRLREGDESLFVNFITGAIDAEDIDIKEEDLTESGKAYEIKDVQGFLDAVDAETIAVMEVTALRDDEDLDEPIAEGDKRLRAVLV